MDNEGEDQNGGPAKKGTTSIWDTLIGYYFVQIKMDISVPGGINPVWYRTRERIFTVVVRIAASVGLIALVFAPRKSFLSGVDLTFAALLAFLFGLGAARIVNYELRVIVFLLLVYGFAFVETLNFGFSVEVLSSS